MFVECALRGYAKRIDVPTCDRPAVSADTYVRRATGAEDSTSPRPRALWARGQRDNGLTGGGSKGRKRRRMADGGNERKILHRKRSDGRNE